MSSPLSTPTGRAAAARAADTGCTPTSGRTPCAGPAARLAGHQLLVVTEQAHTLAIVRGSLAGSGMWIDHVDSAAAAQRYCADGAPQALLIDARLDPSGLDALRRRLARLDPPVVTIDLLPLDISQDGLSDSGRPGTSMRLHAGALDAALAPLLARELAPRG